MKYLIIALISLFSLPASAASYPVSETTCGGYPQAKIGTKKGTCIGIVTQASRLIKWKKPRRIVQVPKTQQFIVTDMGGGSVVEGLSGF